MSSVPLVKRFRVGRPSPAIVISLIALFFAMSGTAVAATGGSFILGKSNTATSVSALANTKGTALSLSSSATAAPLTVSNSVQVPHLNASEVGGVKAGGLVHGAGSVSFGRLAQTGFGSAVFIAAPDSNVAATCDLNDPHTGAALVLQGTQGQATWWSADGTGQAPISSAGDFLSPLNGQTTPFLVVVQADTGSNIETYTLTENYNSSTDTCSFTGQVVTTNG